VVKQKAVSTGKVATNAVVVTPVKVTKASPVAAAVPALI